MGETIAFCPRCGGERLGDALFCVRCGFRLDTAASPPGGAASPGPEPGATQGAPSRTAPGAAPAPGAPVVHESSSQPGEARQSTGTSEVDPVGATVDRVRSLTAPQWALAAGIGMAVATVLPWASTSILGVSVSPLASFGSNVIFAVTVIAALVGLGSSAAMASDLERARQASWRNAFLFASIATIVCAVLVMLAFATSRNAFSALVSPGIGLLLGAISGVAGVVVMVRLPRP
jgi:hypothetical protein